MGLNSEFLIRRNILRERDKRTFLQDTLCPWNKNNVEELIEEEMAIADIR